MIALVKKQVLTIDSNQKLKHIFIKVKYNFYFYF